MLNLVFIFFLVLSPPSSDALLSTACNTLDSAFEVHLARLNEIGMMPQVSYPHDSSNANYLSWLYMAEFIQERLSPLCMFLTSHDSLLPSDMASRMFLSKDIWSAVSKIDALTRSFSEISIFKPVSVRYELLDVLLHLSATVSELSRCPQEGTIFF